MAHYYVLIIYTEKILVSPQTHNCILQACPMHADKLKKKIMLHNYFPSTEINILYQF